MLKIKKVFLVAVSLILMAALVSGCVGKEEKKADTAASQEQHQMQGMNASDIVGMMNQNPDMMIEAMSSPDASQSMTKIMSSEKMMPVMMDMMHNSDMQKNMVKIMSDQKTREAMVKIMSDPAMMQPMMEIMADPQMKDTFMAMMKDPKLMPMAKEAMSIK